MALVEINSLEYCDSLGCLPIQMMLIGYELRRQDQLVCL